MERSEVSQKPRRQCRCRQRWGVLLMGVALGLPARVSRAQLAPPAPDAGAGPVPEGVVADIEGVAPPRALVRRDAVYPAEALARRSEGTVVLSMTVGVDGAVRDVAVEQSAGTSLDHAAIAAAQGWTFAPAMRGGKPVPARIRVPFQFALPLASDAALQLPAQLEAPPLAAGSASPPPAPAPVQVEVRGERRLRTERRAASDFVLSRELITAAPRAEGADVLLAAPGMFIARAEGMAVAHRYMLRGFDADHGQDLELRVGGLPINLPAHIHGQGYADLGFLIGDAVREVHATEGVYDPRQGDFAVAGSIDVRLGVERRGWRAASSAGSFGTFRQLLSWAPPGLDRDTFAAARLQQTDGFGHNRQAASGSAIAQWGAESGPLRYRALAILHGARAELAGVVRADDVASGRVGYYSVYPEATARAQNALSTRALAGAFVEYRGDGGESADASLWLSLDNFRIQQNSTGFVQQSQTLASVAGRGDLIEQLNRTTSLGFSARYRSAPYRPGEWAHGNVELGLSGRMDDIDQAQNLIDAVVRSQTWDRRVDASVLGTDLGLHGDLDWHFSRFLALRAGLRADLLSYAIEDRLGNRATLTRPSDSYIVGFRRSALGLAWGPRTSVELRPAPLVAIKAAYGEGFRSPQARTLDDGEDAPFSKVRSADLGISVGDPAEVRATVAAYYTHLSDDAAFHAEEGRLERVGATRRLGAVAHVEAHPLPWLVGAASVTFVDAELLEPPPPTADEPEPPFRAGQNLPFVPPLVVRADLGARPELLGALSGGPLVGRAGLGFSFLSERPLPYGEFARSVALVDSALGLAWGHFELELEGHNLLDVRYAASELNFASSWSPGAPRTRTPARHRAAGAPRSWLLTLGVAL